MNWYLKVVKNYLGFTGRARRKEFWMFFLINICVIVVLSIIDRIIGIQLLSGLYGLAILLPAIAVGIRRLHDIGKSGWFMLLALVPLANLYLIYLFTIDSVPGSNEYGPNPKEGEMA